MTQIYDRWIYHETERPKIIKSNEWDSYHADGWEDTPAKFLNLEKCGISENDPQRQDKIVQLGDAVDGLSELANGMLNLESMDKKELDEFAKKHFSADLDGRKSKNWLIGKIKDLNDKGDQECQPVASL